MNGILVWKSLIRIIPAYSVFSVFQNDNGRHGVIENLAVGLGAGLFVALSLWGLTITLPGLVQKARSK